MICGEGVSVADLQFETDGTIFFSQFIAELDAVEGENECEK